MSIHRTLCTLVGMALLVGFDGCASRIASAQRGCGVLPLTPERGCGVVPITPEMVVGVWVGFDEDDLIFYRLDLRRDFTGYCASVAPVGGLHKYGVDVYEVTRWGLRDETLLVDMHAVTTNSEAIYLKGSFNAPPLRLEVGGTNGQWKRQIVLHGESEWNAGNLETRRKIRALENK